MSEDSEIAMIVGLAERRAAEDASLQRRTRENDSNNARIILRRREIVELRELEERIARSREELTRIAEEERLLINLTGGADEHDELEPIEGGGQGGVARSLQAAIHCLQGRLNHLEMNLK